MRLDVYHHFGESNLLEAILEKASEILHQVNINNHKIDKIMAAKDEIQSALADIKSAGENIAADLERIANTAEGGLTKEEADGVAADLRATATRLKAIADINPESATTPPTEGTGG